MLEEVGRIVADVQRVQEIAAQAELLPAHRRVIVQAQLAAWRVRLTIRTWKLRRAVQHGVDL